MMLSTCGYWLAGGGVGGVMFFFSPLYCDPGDKSLFFCRKLGLLLNIYSNIPEKWLSTGL